MTIRKEFQVHLLNAASREQAEKLAAAYSTLLDVIEEVCPKSRELSVAITELQTSSMWAKRAIAVVPENQVKEPTP